MEPDWIDRLAAALVAALPAIQREAHLLAASKSEPEAGDDLERERVAALIREHAPAEATCGQAEVRQLLTAAKEAVAWLLNDHEYVCRELGHADLATSGSNVMRHLDNAAEAAERSLAPKRPGVSDFEHWLSEQFTGTDHALRVEALAHSHLLTKDQALALAGHVVSCMELIRPALVGEPLTRDARLGIAQWLVAADADTLNHKGEPWPWRYARDVRRLLEEVDEQKDRLTRKTDGAVAAERWECCKAVCEGCSEGWLYREATNCHYRSVGVAIPCEALAIRKRNETPGVKSGGQSRLLPEAARKLVEACHTCGYDCDQTAVMDGVKAVEEALKEKP